MEQEKQRIIQEFVPGKQVTLAHVIAKAANVEVVFVDRFNGSLIINGTVADVEAAVKDVLNVLENTLHFAPTVITKS